MSAQMVIGFGGRALLAMLFILAGLAKILGPQPFLQHMAQYNVPGVLLPAVYQRLSDPLCEGWRCRSDRPRVGGGRALVGAPGLCIRPRICCRLALRIRS